MTSILDNWSDGPTKYSIVDFVARVSDEDGPDFVEPAARVAVFDNDGTLWCEKPMPIQLDFTVRRLAEMARDDPSLQQQQPWKAAYEKDLHWMGAAMVKHYHGDDEDLRALMGAVTRAFDTVTVEEYDESVRAFFLDSGHPTLGRPYRSCGYAPMVELLRYLEDHGFTNYIASGGDRDFMRPVAGDLYGVPPERVIGSAPGAHLRRRQRGDQPGLQGRDGVLRRRPGEADPDLEPDRPSPDPVRSATPTATSRCWPSRASRPPRAALAAAPRRCGPRVRLRRRGRGCARHRREGAVDGREDEVGLERGLRAGA